MGVGGGDVGELDSLFACGGFFLDAEVGEGGGFNDRLLLVEGDEVFFVGGGGV